MRCKPVISFKKEKKHWYTSHASPKGRLQAEKMREKKYCYIFWLLLWAKWQETRQRAVIIFSLYLILSLFRELSLWHFSFFLCKFLVWLSLLPNLGWTVFFSSHISTTISTVRVLTQGNALTSACSYCVRQHVTPSVINAVVMKKDVLKVFISFFVLLNLICLLCFQPQPFALLFCAEMPTWWISALGKA